MTKQNWLPMHDAPRDGSILCGRFWGMHDAPRGPYPFYVLMQWDELENEGWMDLDGLSFIGDPVVDYIVVESKDAMLAERDRA